MKWYHGSSKDFSEVDLNKLRPGDYGTGLYLTDNKDLARAYSGNKYIYEVHLNIEPMTTLEKIIAISKTQNIFEKSTIKNAPYKEEKDARGIIAVVRDLSQILSIKQLDSDFSIENKLDENSDLSM